MIIITTDVENLTKNYSPLLCTYW